MGALVQTTKSQLTEKQVVGFGGDLFGLEIKCLDIMTRGKYPFVLWAPCCGKGAEQCQTSTWAERHRGWEGVRRVKIPTRKQKMRLKGTFWPWGLLSAGEGLKAKVSLLILFSISRVHFNNPFVYGTMTLASPILSRFSTLEGEMG